MNQPMTTTVESPATQYVTNVPKASEPNYGNYRQLLEIDHRDPYVCQWLNSTFPEFNEGTPANTAMDSQNRSGLHIHRDSVASNRDNFWDQPNVPTLPSQNEAATEHNHAAPPPANAMPYGYMPSGGGFAPFNTNAHAGTPVNTPARAPLSYGRAAPPPPINTGIRSASRMISRPVTRDEPLPTGHDNVTRPVIDNNTRVNKVARTPRRRSPSSSPDRRASTGSGRKKSKLNDEENLEIARLRVHGLLEWPEIVGAMNGWRRSRNMPESFTDAAVYGRFKRNGPTLFVRNGFQSFDPAEFMHLKHTRGRLSKSQVQAIINSFGAGNPTHNPTSHGNAGPSRRASGPARLGSGPSRLFLNSAATADEGANQDRSSPASSLNDADGDPDDDYHPPGRRSVPNARGQTTSSSSPVAQQSSFARIFKHAVDATMQHPDGSGDGWAQVSRILATQGHQMDAAHCKSLFMGHFGAVSGSC